MEGQQIAQGAVVTEVLPKFKTGFLFFTDFISHAYLLAIRHGPMSHGCRAVVLVIVLSY